jgi:hypothetical protein
MLEMFGLFVVIQVGWSHALRRYGTSRKVEGSNTDALFENFKFSNSFQPLHGPSTRSRKNISGE